jgi:hypothetical protein
MDLKSTGRVKPLRELLRIYLPRTRVNKSYVPILVRTEVAPELARSHRLKGCQCAH